MDVNSLGTGWSLDRVGRWIAQRLARTAGISRAISKHPIRPFCKVLVRPASGSEVALIVKAHEALAARGIRSRVVSMPSWDIFEQQPQSYRDEVLLPTVKARVAVEQGSVLGWDRYVGAAGRIIGMKTFGASAPLKELQRRFGFEPERVVAAAMEVPDPAGTYNESQRTA